MLFGLKEKEEKGKENCLEIFFFDSECGFGLFMNFFKNIDRVLLNLDDEMKCGFLDFTGYSIFFRPTR